MGILLVVLPTILPGDIHIVTQRATRLLYRADARRRNTGALRARRSFDAARARLLGAPTGAGFDRRKMLFLDSQRMPTGRALLQQATMSRRRLIDARVPTARRYTHRA